MARYSVYCDHLISIKINLSPLPENAKHLTAPFPYYFSTERACTSFLLRPLGSFAPLVQGGLSVRTHQPYHPYSYLCASRRTCCRLPECPTTRNGTGYFVPTVLPQVGVRCGLRNVPSLNLIDPYPPDPANRGRDGPGNLPVHGARATGGQGGRCPQRHLVARLRAL